MSTFQRSQSGFRDVRTLRTVPCAGDCGVTVETRCAWDFCIECAKIARASINARTRGMSGVEYQQARNLFWGSEQAVRDAVQTKVTG